MKKLGKIVPAILLALTLSTLAACGCGKTGQNESNMVENTTQSPSPGVETEDTTPPVVADPNPSDISGNEADLNPDMNGGNITVADDIISDDNTGLLDDAGNAVGDVIDGAGNAVNDAVDGITEGINDMTGNGAKTTR